MKLYLYFLDSLSDWEIGYLTAEVHSRRFFAAKDRPCEIVKVGYDLQEIRTMGGIAIKPDLTVDGLAMDDDDVLVLPGADTWFDPRQDRILELARSRILKDLPVAAICGATLGLARVGALNDRRHTSNDLGFMKSVATAYSGEGNYQDLPAVSDRNLITASGFAPVQFTYEVLKLLGLFKPAALEAWRDLNLTRDPAFFFALMAALA
jgi:putative intracellular protease/amidase